MGYKKGFNFIESYPIEFSEKIVSVRYSGKAENFRFSFPEKRVEHIMINLCPTEPWALPHWAVIKGNTSNFLHKLGKIRSEYFPDSQCSIVVDRRENKLINDLTGYGKNYEWLHKYIMKPVYPYDSPVLIIKNILGLQIAFGKDTIEHGVLLMEPQTVTDIFERYIRQRETTARLIPVSGSGLKENRILKIKSGTPLKSVLKRYIRSNIRYRVFFDGLLNGTEIEDMNHAVDWSVKNIVVMEEKDYKYPFPYFKTDELRFTTNLMGELRRCVYCNYCDDICPVNLEPALYWHCYSRGEKQKARTYALDKCIECGLCSYICPSKLELLKVIKECKNSRTLNNVKER